MLQRLLVVPLLIALAGCGGGGSPSAPTPTPIPAATPVPVSYTGTYSSNTLTFTDESGTALSTASLRIAESGTTLIFSALEMTSPYTAHYPLPSPLPAAASNGRFEGSGSYVSTGCGRATSRFTGYFSSDGGIVNITIALAFTGNCGNVDIRGEMRR